MGEGGHVEEGLLGQGVVHEGDVVLVVVGVELLVLQHHVGQLGLGVVDGRDVGDVRGVAQLRAEVRGQLDGGGHEVRLVLRLRHLVWRAPGPGIRC